MVESVIEESDGNVYTISVEARHIKKGVRNSINFCPIALAAKEATGYTCTVSSWLRGYRYGKHQSTKVFVYPLPDEAATFMCRFDTGKPVEPFTFTVGAPNALADENRALRK